MAGNKTLKFARMETAIQVSNLVCGKHNRTKCFQSRIIQAGTVREST